MDPDQRHLSKSASQLWQKHFSIEHLRAFLQMLALANELWGYRIPIGANRSQSDANRSYLRPVVRSRGEDHAMPATHKLGFRAALGLTTLSQAP
jgi:hypothetical protein